MQTSRQQEAKNMIKRNVYLYDQSNDIYYSGYTNKTYNDNFCIVNVFAIIIPILGSTIIDKITGRQYRIRRISHKQKKEHLSVYEIVLNGV